MSTTRRGQHLLGKELGSCILEKLLGYGGSSAVFLAQQHTPQRKVAVKVFLPRSNLDLQMQRSFYTRFLHEAEAASELDHPAILPIYAYGEQDSLPYIVMPYMQGGTLAEYIGKNGPLSVEEAQWYLEQITSALDYAHEHGCVHCDVKPANILLDGEGHAMLSDFGIARVMQLDPANKDALKRNSETLMGTPDYISPEQALGQPLDGRSDVYSLGVTLFYLLTGSPPFKADNSIAMALLHVHEPPPSLSLFRDDISPALDRVVGKALNKWPDDRFQTAGKLSAAFARAVSDPESFDEADAADEHGKISRGSRSTPRHVLASSAPASFVHVRPVRRRPFSLSRTLLMIVLVIAVLLSTITAAFIIWLANAHYSPKVSPSATPTKAIEDILIDDQNSWPYIRGEFFFKNGQYHIRNNLQSSLEGALALYGNGTSRYQYADFHLTLTMSEVQGPLKGEDYYYYYGVIFRSTDKVGFYLFEVTAANGGEFVFYRADNKDGNPVYRPIVDGIAPSLLPNPGQNNVLTIDAKGNGFTFLINGKPVLINGKPAVRPILDPTQPALTSGAIGLFVDDPGAEVAFSQMQINRLK